MRYKLKPFQVTGSKYLASRPVALLGDDMGLGKTIQTIDALRELKAEKVFIVCSAAARGVWEREILKFAPEREPVVLTKIKGNVSLSKMKTIIVSYDLARKLQPFLLGLQFDAVVLDEAHYLKNPKSKRTISIFGEKGIRLYKPKNVWALSGTPMPNHPGELWTLCNAFGATRLTYNQFTEYFCATRPCSFSPQGFRVVGARKERIPELRSLLATFMLRRSKEEVLSELPAITHQMVPVDADDSIFEDKNMLRGEFEKLRIEEDEAKTIIQAAKGDPTIAAKLLESHALSMTTLRRYTGMRKALSSASLIKEELKDGAYEKIIVFAWHKKVIELLAQELKEFNPVVMMGGAGHEARANAEKRFQHDPECRVFLGNIMAAGTAITLTAASQVFFVEMDFVPANNAQAADRAHRIGQTKGVLARYAYLAGSIDEQISEILVRKQTDLTLVFEHEVDREKVLTNLSPEAIEQNEWAEIDALLA